MISFWFIQRLINALTSSVQLSLIKAFIISGVLMIQILWYGDWQRGFVLSWNMAVNLWLPMRWQTLDTSTCIRTFIAGYF